MDQKALKTSLEANPDFSDEQLEALFKMTDSECQSYKNWIASAVEGGRFPYAQELTKKLRAHQELFAKLNGARRARGLGEWAKINEA